MQVVVFDAINLVELVWVVLLVSVPLFWYDVETMVAPTVAVVVAVSQSERQGLVRRALGSVLNQDVEADVRVFVQVDGDAPHDAVAAIRGFVGESPNVVVRALGEQAGPAATRNEVLAWLEPSWLVTTLDGDDMLPPRSLACRIDALSSGGFLWSAGRVLLREDGVSKVIGYDCPFGDVSPEAVVDVLRRGKVTLPPHVAVLAPVESWWSVGGFAGLVYGEDDVALSALLTLGSGFVLKDLVYVYERRSSGESKRRDGHAHSMVAASKERWRRLRIGLPPV